MARSWKLTAGGGDGHARTALSVISCRHPLAMLRQARFKTPPILHDATLRGSSGGPSSKMTRTGRIPFPGGTLRAGSAVAEKIRQTMLGLL
jgi:hypothetical protein